MKQLRAFLTLISLFFLFSTTSFAKAIQRLDIQSLTTGKQTLRLGYISNFPPFWLPGTTNQGMNADIFNQIEKQGGIQKTERIAFPNMAALKIALQTGQIDLFSAFVTPESKKDYLFTLPYYRKGGVGILYRGDQWVFHHLSDLKHHSIGVYQGSYANQWLDKNGIPEKNIKAYDSPHAMIMALLHHDVDVVAGDFTFLMYTKNHMHHHHWHVTQLAQLDLAYALRKQDVDLQQHLNTVMHQLWDNASLYRIKQKYLKPIDIEAAHGL